VDRRAGSRENPVVLAPGTSRQQIASTLNAAFADGLLSEETFAHRLDELLGAGLIDPHRLVGDLNLRASRHGLFARLAAAVSTVAERIGDLSPDRHSQQRAVLLALDWSGAQEELLIGRLDSCDVVLENPTVSRRHARLIFRDGCWVLQDLASTNGTVVNGVAVGRCELRPGDELAVGTARLRVD
jgi:hypothetical protein